MEVFVGTCLVCVEFVGHGVVFVIWDFGDFGVGYVSFDVVWG